MGRVAVLMAEGYEERAEEGPVAHPSADHQQHADRHRLRHRGRRVHLDL